MFTINSCISSLHFFAIICSSSFLDKFSIPPIEYLPSSIDILLFLSPRSIILLIISSANFTFISCFEVLLVILNFFIKFST